MKRRFAEFEKNLARLLDDKLLRDIYSFREKRLAHIENIVGEMKDRLGQVSADASAETAIAHGIEALRDFSRDDYRSISDEIVSGVFAVANQLPKRKILPQLPERFRILRDDEIHIKAGKAVKQLVRHAGKTDWRQKIPVQQVLAYHLLDAEWLFKDWISAEERLRMQIILELDEVLTDLAGKESGQGEGTKLQQLLKVIQNHIDEAKRVHEQKLYEARDSFIHQFIDIYAKVDTFERRNKHYTQQRVMEKRNHAQHALYNYLKRWQEANGAMLDRTEGMYVFLRFVGEINQMTNVFRSNIGDIFKADFFTPYQALTDHLQDARRELPDLSDEIAAFVNRREEELQFIEQEVANPLRKSMKDGEIQYQMQLFAEQLIERAGELPESILLINDLNQSEDPPAVTTEYIHWQRLVRRNLKQKITDRIGIDKRPIETFTYDQINELENIENMLRMKLKSALDMEEEHGSSEDAQAMIAQALQQAEEQVQKCREQVREMQQRLFDRLTDGMDQFKVSLFNLLHEGDTGDLQSSEIGEQTSTNGRGDYAGISNKSKMQLEDLLVRIHLWARFMRKNISARIKNPRGQDAITPPNTPTETTDNSRLPKIALEINKLPYAYQRVFNNDKEKKSSAIGLDLILEECRQAWADWQEGLPAVLAVTGERGSGTSTCLRRMREEVPATENTLYIELMDGVHNEKGLLDLFNTQFKEAKCTSSDELIRFLNEKHKGEVIILDGIEHLFLRYKRGYEGVKEFLYVLSETRRNIFWIVGCTPHARTFLDKAFDWSSYITHQWHTDRLNRSQIESLIMQRHKASGYAVVFEMDHNRSQQAKNNGEGDEMQAQTQENFQQFCRDEYFDALADRSAGNASIAIREWMRSVQTFNDERIVVRPPTAAVQLPPLTTNEWFVLASLILHDGLTPAELALTQSMNTQDARLLLRRLEKSGLAEEKSRIFDVDLLAYRPVCDQLQQKRMLQR